MVAQMAGNWWSLVLLGIAAGMISGTLGLGSGTIVIPALVLLFGCEQKSAQGIALAVMVPMALLAAFVYWRNPRIDVDLAAAGIMAVGAIAGVLAGAFLADRLSGPTLRRIFAIYLLAIGVKMLFFPGTPAKRTAAAHPHRPDNALVERQDSNGQVVN
jgi:hypothetical protein